MKKIVSIVLCLLLLWGCLLPVRASGGVPEAVMEATKSVVRIRSEYARSVATGSGFVIKNEPGEVLIVTNNHVVEDNPRNISIWVGEEELMEAKIVFTTAEKDLCVLKVTDPVDMKPLTLSTAEPQHGGAIYAAGYPSASDILSDTQAHTSDSVTITDGIISAIRSFTIEEGGHPVQLLQINAAINSGNSGGPLFDSDGLVIGVNTYKVNADSQGVFGSVAISELWQLLEQHGIQLTREEVPEAMEEASSGLPGWYLAVGAGGLAVLVLLVGLIHRRKHPKRRPSRKAIPLGKYMAAHPGGLGANGAVTLLMDAALELRNLHAKGQLHLQISPDTLLISHGSARLQSATDSESRRFCSGYAAPEVYRGAGFGITSDVYSFGGVLYYAATGRDPANSLDRIALTQQLYGMENAAFAQVLELAMAENPQDRAQSMQDLIYAMAVFHRPEAEEAAEAPAMPQMEEPVAEEPAQEEPTGWEEVPREVVSTAKGRWWKLVPVAVACLALAGWLLWPDSTFARPELSATTPASTTEAATETTQPPLSAEELAYQQAESWASDGQLGRAAIAFGKLGDFSDAREQSFALWNQFTPRTVCLGSIVLKDDGTIEGISGSYFLLGQSNLIDLEDTTGNQIGLKADGTVVSSELDVSEWKDIVAVAPGATYYEVSTSPNSSYGYGEPYLIGLKSDGTVVATGDALFGTLEVSDWTDIVAIYSGSYGTVDITSQYGSRAVFKSYIRATTRNSYTIGLKYDGTLVTTGNIPESWDLTEWTDIVKLSVSGEYMAGLRSDGTAIATHYDVSDWKDLTDINAGEYHVLGLRADGTVAAIGNRYMYHHLEVDDWSNIVSLSASSHHTVGLRSDGTVIAIGSTSDSNVCNVSDWENIVAIYATDSYTVGWRADGTAVKSGRGDPIDCYTDVKVPTKLLPARNGRENTP